MNNEQPNNVAMIYKDKILGSGYTLANSDFTTERSIDNPFTFSLTSLILDGKKYRATIKRWDEVRSIDIPYKLSNYTLSALCVFVESSIKQLGTGYDKDVLALAIADGCLLISKGITDTALSLIETQFIESDAHYIKFSNNRGSDADWDYGQIAIGLYKNGECINSSLTSIELYEHLNTHRDTFVEMNFNTESVEAAIDKGVLGHKKFAWIALDRDESKVNTEGYECMSWADRMRMKLSLLGEDLAFDERGVLLVDVYDNSFDKDEMRKLELGSLSI